MEMKNVRNTDVNNHAHLRNFPFTLSSVKAEVLVITTVHMQIFPYRNSRKVF